MAQTDVGESARSGESRMIGRTDQDGWPRSVAARRSESPVPNAESVSSTAPAPASISRQSSSRLAQRCAVSPVSARIPRLSSASRAVGGSNSSRSVTLFPRLSAAVRSGAPTIGLGDRSEQAWRAGQETLETGNRLTDRDMAVVKAQLANRPLVYPRPLF